MLYILRLAPDVLITAKKQVRMHVQDGAKVNFRCFMTVVKTLRANREIIAFSDSRIAFACIYCTFTCIKFFTLAPI